MAYIPPPQFGCAHAFFTNLTQFKTHYDLITYSDHDWPGVIKLKASPEQVKGASYTNGQPNTWSVNNLIFATGLRIASKLGYTHFLYLESDCRVMGDGWDRKVFEEFLVAGEGKLIGGSVVTYNTCNASMAFMRRWRDFIAYHANAQFPIPSYGFTSAAEKSEPIVLVNGALGIYDVEFVRTVIDIETTAHEAARVTAWDYHIGRELVRKFGEEAFTRVAHLSSIYSGYSNVLTSEEERISWLTAGLIVGVHQVKSNWIPERPMPVPANDTVAATTVSPANVGSDDGRPEPSPQLGLRIIGEAEEVSYDVSLLSSYVIIERPPHEPCKTCLWWAPNRSETIEKMCHLHKKLMEDDDGCSDHLSPEQAEQKTEYQVPQHTKHGAEMIPERIPVPGPVEILIVTHAKDFLWLEYCLLAAHKHLSGFQGVTIAHPNHEQALFKTLIGRFNVRLHGYDEVRGKGMLQHMVKMAQADLIVPKGTEYVMHLDADCVYHTPTRPSDYFVNGLPVYLWRSYDSLTTEDPKDPFSKVVSDCAQWKAPTEAQLGFPIEAYTMCRHPTIFPIAFYEDYRTQVEWSQNKNFEDYMLNGKNEFPQNRMDFTAMGAFAFHCGYLKDFHWIDVETMPYPKDRQKTFHSHSGITPAVKQEIESFLK